MTHRFPELLLEHASVRRLAVRVVVLLLAGLIPASGSVAQTQQTSGTSSRQAKKQTIESLPYHQLTASAKQKLSGVLKSPSFYRRLPATTIQADPDYHQFLVRYPEVIVNVWQLMGITKMSTERTGPFSLKTNDGAGTISDLELIYGSQDLHIYFGRGTYEGPVIRRAITGNCVLVLKTTYRPGPANVPTATNELDVFIKVENATANLVAKTLQPLIGPTADHNFVESVKFVQRLNDTTRKNGPGVQQMAKRFAIKESVRQDFVAVAGDVFQRAAQNQASASANYLNSSSVPATPARSATVTRTSQTPPVGFSSSNRQYDHLAPHYANDWSRYVPYMSNASQPQTRTAAGGTSNPRR